MTVMPWKRIYRWWRDATRAPCPVCGRNIDVGREWQTHKAIHDPDVWKAAISSKTRLP